MAHTRTTAKETAIAPPSFPDGVYWARDRLGKESEQ